MFALAALSLLGLHTSADPWINHLLGVPQMDAMEQLRLDDAPGTFVTPDGKIAIELMGDPTMIVWAMNPEYVYDDFSARTLLDELGFDGKKASMTVWDRGMAKTPMVKNLAGLKPGWVPFVGPYDMLFVGPKLAADFDRFGRGVGVKSYVPGLAGFAKDPTWRGAVKSYGKAQHLEMTNAGFLALSWRGAGLVKEVILGIDIVRAENAADRIAAYRTQKSCTAELVFMFAPGVKDWKKAFKAAGLNTAGVSLTKEESQPGYVTFKNVTSGPRSWEASATYEKGNMTQLTLHNTDWVTVD
jgi:hypothetical protein